MSYVFVKQLVAHVIENPKHYPGPHNLSQPRTSQGLAVLDTTRQMLLIWDAMSNYIRENLEGARSVNIPNFGTFTFEPILMDDPMRYNRERTMLRPCFVVNNQLRETLYRYPGKEEIRKTPNSASVYAEGRGATFLNVKPIAAGCYYREEVISSAIRAFFQGVIDLVKRDYNVHLDFNGAKVIITSRNMHVKFDPVLTTQVQDKMTRVKAKPISSIWKSANLSASMMNFIERPNSPEMVAMKNRTAHLSILSLDMASCAQPGMTRSHSTPAVRSR
jgi:hypothetical protein